MSRPIVVDGLDDPNVDCEKVQRAVDHEGMNVIVLRGPFNFGDGSSSKRKTVLIRKPVAIVGEVWVPSQENSPVPYPLPDPNPVWPPVRDPITGWPPDRRFKIATHIKGGGKSDVTPFGDAEIGPFGVELPRMSSGPVLIAGISFSGWAGEAISANSCDGLAVINCEFTKPVPTTPTRLGLPFVHAIMAVGSGCQGNFHAINNVAAFGGYTTPPADEQLLACVMSNFRAIEIVGNLIKGHDEGLEVILNGLDTNTTLASISIKNNIITLSNLLPENPNWEGHFGIVCCRNRNPKTTISGNNITVTGPAIALSLSGEHLTVTNNDLALNAVTLDDPSTYPFAGIVLGSNSWPFFPAGPGPSLNHSVISNNTFSGVADFAMLTQDENSGPPDPEGLPP